MPRRQPPKNSTWVQLTKDFVKEWPEVLEGLRQTISQNYVKIKSVDMKFDIPALKKDMESKTSLIMAKTFRK
jgi:hypothetical protein